MVQSVPKAIRVGIHEVAAVFLEGGAVKGEGGPAHPVLVVPLTLTSGPAADPQLAVVWLRAQLQWHPQAHPDALVGSPISEPLVNGFPVRSGAPPHTVTLRFGLTPTEVEALEQRRHAAGGDVFTLCVGLEAIAAALRTHNQAGQPPEKWSLPSTYGLLSELVPFWDTQVLQPIPVAIERATWVRQVLAGLRYDRVRLIEVTFPPPLPDHASAAVVWDQARCAVDEQRYGDAISAWRGLREMRRQHWVAPKHGLARAVAERRGWSTGDAARPSWTVCGRPRPIS